MHNNGINSYWLALLFIAIAISFLSIGSMPLMDVDEGAFTEATREMFERNNFLATYLNGEPRHDKPILFYWFQAASISLFGLNEFAMRLPSVLCGIAWAISIGWFCRRIAYNQRTALLATLMLLSSLHLTVIIKVATAEAIMNLWLALTMFHLILYLTESKTENLIYAAIFAALGFLTKGPIALIFPGALLVANGVLCRQFKPIFTILASFRIWGIFLVIALPWYIAVTLYDGGAFLQGFFLHHNVDRFNSTMEGHSGAFYYYIPVVVLALMPYTGLLFKVVRNYKVIWSTDVTRLLLIWFLSVLLLFSFSSTKLPHYMIYGYSGLFVLFAIEADKISYQRWYFIPPLILTVVFLAFPFILDWIVPQIKNPYLHDMINEGKRYFTIYYSLILLVVIVGILWFIFGKPTYFHEKLVISGLASSFIISLYIMPAVINAYQTPIIESAKIVKNRTEKVVLWRYNMPSFSVYREHITPSGFPEPGNIVLTKAKYVNDLPAHSVLYQSHGALLAKINQ